MSSTQRPVRAAWCLLWVRQERSGQRWMDGKNPSDLVCSESIPELLGSGHQTPKRSETLPRC